MQAQTVWSHLLLHCLYFLLPVLAWRSAHRLTWMLTMIVWKNVVLERSALPGSVIIVARTWHTVSGPVGWKARNTSIGATIAGTNGMPPCIPCKRLPRALIHRRTQRCSSKHCLRDLDIIELGLVGKWHQRSYRGMHIHVYTLGRQRSYRCVVCTWCWDGGWDAGVCSDCIAV